MPLRDASEAPPAGRSRPPFFKAFAARPETGVHFGAPLPMSAAGYSGQLVMSWETSADGKHDVAARARRLAQTLLLDADRDRLLRYANELDEEAEELDRHADSQASHSALTADRGIVRQQQQEQQQESKALPDDEPQPSKPKPR